MPSSLVRTALLAATAALPAILFAIGGAPAAETPWQEVTGAKVRLIATGADPQAPLGDAAVEIQLDPGWHTYWHFPGEAGIPTQAEFGGSSGIGDARLRFPPPERYTDPYATSIVYRDKVVLPIDLQPAENSTDALLDVRLSLGVCREICAPGEARLTLPLGEAEPDFAARMAIAAARLSLPQPQGESAPRIAEAMLEPGPDAKEAALRIRVDLPAGTGDVDLFAAGAPGSYNGVPQQVSRDDVSAVFRLPLRGFEPAPGGSRPVSLLLVTDGAAVSHDLDLNRLAQP